MENQTHKSYRLNNVMFPIYMLFLFFPQVWLVALPFNFAFDSLVLVLAMRHWHFEGKKEIWKKSILRVWGFGFLADIVGAALITALAYLIEIGFDINIYFSSGTEMLTAIPGVALAGWLIYLFDKKWAFRKTALEAVQKHKLALALAVFTAPYTMLIPTRLLYGGMW